MNQSYDRIGVDYARLRRPDRRIAAHIADALGSARTVLNIGAGAGSYEPPDRQLVALEPSLEMIRQRPEGAAPVVQGRAEALPFRDRAFDASMAVLTVHHWPDPRKGLEEMRRVTSDRVVILTYDPGFRGFWLTDYIPELIELDERQMPPMADYARSFDPVRIERVPIPHDCTDGFLCAYWRRPHSYLDPRVRAAMSSFWALGDVSAALRRLEEDLESGAWAEKYADLLGRDALDLGYRLVIAGTGAGH